MNKIFIFAASLSVSMAHADQRSCEIYKDRTVQVERELDAFNKGPFKQLKDAYDDVEDELKFRDKRPVAIDNEVKKKEANNLERRQAIEKLEATIKIHRDEAAAHRAKAAAYRAEGKEQKAKEQDRAARDDDNAATKQEGKIDEYRLKIEAAQKDIDVLKIEKSGLATKVPSVDQLNQKKSQLDRENTVLIEHRNQIKVRLDSTEQILHMCRDLNCESVKYDVLKQSIQLIRLNGCDVSLERPENQCERDAADDARRSMGCL